MTTTTTRRQAATAPETSRKAGIVAGLLIAAVVAAIVLAMALGNSGDKTTDNAAADSARIPTSGTLRQASFAEAAGTGLPTLDASLGNDSAAGMDAPNITASYFDNTEVTIDFADGQPRVVLFFAHWCPHCQGEVQDLVKRFERDGVRDDVEIIAISTNVDQGAPNYPPSQWLVREQWPLPVLRDSASNDLAAGFGLNGFPFTVVIDGNGQVVSRQSGAVPAARWNPMLDLATAQQEHP